MVEKRPEESIVRMTELVLPNDTNLLGNLLGGRLMHWMDIAGALAATRHARARVVTVQADQVQFKHPIRKGSMVELEARLIWVGNTSMTVKVSVHTEELITGKQQLTNEAYFTFVAVDENEKPIKVPKLKLETDQAKEDFNYIQKRKDCKCNE